MDFYFQSKYQLTTHMDVMKWKKKLAEIEEEKQRKSYLNSQREIDDIHMITNSKQREWQKLVKNTRIELEEIDLKKQYVHSSSNPGRMRWLCFMNINSYAGGQV